MRTVWLALLVAGLGACAHGNPKPQTILEMHQTNDWAYDRGERLYAALANDVSRIARKNGRAATLEQLAEAGYTCEYGEAHEDYPEPAAVCTRSFATRACQFDWEVTVTSAPKRADSIYTTDVDFRRDCVNTGLDWPEPVRSAIDDGLAPAEPPL